MLRKQLHHLVMALFIVLATACGPVQLAAAPGCEGNEIKFQDYQSPAFQDPEKIESLGKVLDATLEVKYGDNQIAKCHVHLRSYNGKLVGPTLRARPGDTLQIHIKNMLPPNPPMDHENMNIPHDFNTTNLHTHGLHVSPDGNSDNVLRTMEPPKAGSKEADYEVIIQVPLNHPAGTFWYHPHVHGSTAIQVSSGMEGALIIEGGLDNVPEIKAAQEKIFVFQQIAYDTQGQIENFDTSLGFKNNNSQWVNLHRQHTINGQLFPTLKMRPGELQRWRMIHAGVEETIMATLYGPFHDENLCDDSPSAIQRRNKDFKHPIKLHEIAEDGLALGKIDDWSQVELQPGYRSDVLVELEKKGTYYLVDEASDANKSLHGVAEPEKCLARIHVTGEAVQPPTPLPDASELAPLRPFKDIADDEITGYQSVVFCMCQVPNSNALLFTVNGKSFDPAGPPRQLKLNSVEEWEVSTDINSLAPSHPFHIHVNPFQFVRLGPDGTREVVWKDTLLIRQGTPQKLRMRYLDFPGTFVMHCHILGHEDQGMMEKIQIVP